MLSLVSVHKNVFHILFSRERAGVNYHVKDHISIHRLRNANCYAISTCNVTALWQYHFKSSLWNTSLVFGPPGFKGHITCSLQLKIGLNAEVFACIIEGGRKVTPSEPELHPLKIASMSVCFLECSWEKKKKNRWILEKGKYPRTHRWNHIDHLWPLAHAVSITVADSCYHYNFLLLYQI